MNNIEVVIPEMRPQHLDNIVHSFNVNGPPALITLVSNLDLSISVTKPCPVRQLKYSSDRYSTGPFTMVLKRNIGAWFAKHDRIIFFDDDQLAGIDLISTFDKLLDTSDVIWGHHHFVDYNKYSVQDILQGDLPFTPREAYIGKHYWESGYGGLMGFHQDYYIKLGGTDMWFQNVGSAEDQDFARRVMLDKGWDGIEVHDPPFAYHPIYHPDHRLPITPEPANTCNIHQIVTKTLHNIDYSACKVCPWHAAPRVPLLSRLPLMVFNPVWVNVEEVWL